MIIEDLRSFSSDAPVETDLCIVGSGLAGWTIAEELRLSPLRILMLESGGLEDEPQSQALNDIESVGATFLNGRERRLGGTSWVWYGRCIALDEVDYEAREWVPLSGWPIGSAVLAPHLQRALAHLDAGVCQPGGGRTPWIGAPPVDVDPGLLRGACWEDAPALNTAHRILTGEQRNLRVLLHATVTHINTNSEGTRLESLEVACSPDKRVTVIPRAVVLCAGGVENARIMLYSNRIRQHGVGNDHDVVGRYFMDHPRDVELLVRFGVRDANWFRHVFGPHRLTSPGGRREIGYGFALSPDLQRHEGLVNCAALPFEVQAPDDPLQALKRLAVGPREQLREDARRVVSQPRLVAEALRARVARQRVRHKVARVGFLVYSEQIPNRDSRVRLSDRRDSLGLPISRIDWRIDRREKVSQAVLAKTIANECRRLALPHVELADWVRNDDYEAAALIDSSHPTGATRMADDPRHGVLNSDCQVHDVEGLYVAGSSVFPTAGHANPTLMAVALAVRLARHLETRLSGRAEIRLDAGDSKEESEESAPQSLSAPHMSPMTKAVVTGATGFIGRRLVHRLIADGTQVTCFVRPGATADRLPASVAVRELELSDVGALRTQLQGVDVVFHCAYDWSDEGWNVRAVRALVAACRANRIRLVHLSSFVVYSPTDGEPVTEDTAQTAAQAGYAHSKLGLEAELAKAIAEGGLEAVILQPTIVYGPFSRPWADAPADMLRYGRVVLPADGGGICNAVYVDDVVSAMVLAASHPRAAGERFLISGPEAVSWSRFYDDVATAVGARGPEYVPPSQLGGRLRRLLAIATDPMRVIARLVQTGPGGRALRAVLALGPGRFRGLIESQVFVSPTRRPGAVHRPDVGYPAAVSSDKARALLGYEPQFDFAGGMVATAAYLREYAGVEAPLTHRPDA